MGSNGRALEAARRELDVSIYELWVAYVSLGGGSDAFALKSYLDGTSTDDAVSELDHDILEQAIIEMYSDLALPNPWPRRTKESVPPT